MSEFTIVASVARTIEAETQEKAMRVFMNDLYKIKDAKVRLDGVHKEEEDE